jgi:hypothetical protein
MLDALDDEVVIGLWGVQSGQRRHRDQSGPAYPNREGSAGCGESVVVKPSGCPLVDALGLKAGVEQS